MNRFAFLVSIAGILGTASAENCTQILNEGERLTCFDETRHCARIPSGDARLKCFDKAYSNTEDTPQPIEIHATPEEFAAENTPGTESGEVVARISEVITNTRKIDFLQLENGHVWRENEDSRVRFEVGQEVRIKEGIFGSFNLTVEGSKKLIKVKRVR